MDFRRNGHKTKNIVKITKKSFHCRHVKIMLLTVKKKCLKKYFYYDDHKEERKACFSKYYAANKEKMKAYFCKYYDSIGIKERPPLINTTRLTRIT